MENRVFHQAWSRRRGGSGWGCVQISESFITARMIGIIFLFDSSIEHSSPRFTQHFKTSISRFGIFQVLQETLASFGSVAQSLRSVLQHAEAQYKTTHIINRLATRNTFKRLQCNANVPQSNESRILLNHMVQASQPEGL